MKKNLISAIAGWKSAALLALVAMVAAVAFSGVLTSTESAEAQAGADQSGVPGQTVTVTFNAGTDDRYRISTDSEGSASFAFNGGQSLRCADDATNGCDTDADSGEVGIQVTIDEDSPIGEIYVQRIARSDTGVVTVSQELTITVNRPNPVAAIKAANRVTSAISKDTPATEGGALIVVQVVNAGGVGINGAPLQVTTTRGGLSIADAVTGVVGDSSTTPPTAAVRTRTRNTAAPGTTCPNETDALAGNAACTILASTAGNGTDGTAGNSDDELGGIVAVVLKGNGGTGTAEVVFRHPVSGHSHKVNVILHGAAASISASVDQSTIGIGNSTFIVVDVSDADGNPVPNITTVVVDNHKPLVPAQTGPEVPAGSTANLVSTSFTTNRDLPDVVNDVPSCEAHTTLADEDAGTPASSSTGTSLGGKCAIQVTAGAGGPGPADDATRGTHSLTLAISTNPRIAPVTVEVEVGGAPASIENDAPASVESLSTTSISITVLDDEGVRVGAVPISVVKVEGSGNVDDVAGGMTSDGRATFTYLAPLTPGEAVFLIRAGGSGQVIQDTITLAIGDVAPEAPDATWNKELVSGQNLVVWNGADGADPSAGAAEGVSSIWSYNTGAGSWDGYFPNAADVPGGNTLGSLSNGDAYFVIVD
ncbi:MAG: hypothetical protein OXS47_07850 [Chloroflexota bacterium]|nr:hypothetical protein [Chloroflexota bacterium]